MDKSAMKKAYKEMKQPMGIFWIRNTQNENIYIGSGTNVQARINRHKAELKFGSHRNRELQEIWNSFGESALNFEVLDILDLDEDAQTNPTEELRVLIDMWTHRLEDEGHSVVII